MLLGAPGPDVGNLSYRSAFKQWNEKAAVRAAPRRELSTDADRLYFTPDLVPYASHPVVVERLGTKQYERMLIQYLYRYLNFTTKLEHLVVNRTVLGLAHGTVELGMPEQMRFDAFKIYCDEAYHALAAQDLLRQVARRTGVRPRLPETPYFLRRLHQLHADIPRRQRPLADLLFVIVSETLISGTLSDVPDDPRVERGVHEVIREHAVDEGRHHAYFAAVLRLLWRQLPAADRVAGALLVPDLIRAFLAPDVAAADDELRGYGLSQDESARVLDEVWSPETVAETTRAAAGRTVRYFRDLGALDDPKVADRFMDNGLVAS